MKRILVLVLLSFTFLQAEIRISPEIDSIQSIIDSIDGSLCKIPFYTKVQYLPVSEKITYFKELLEFNSESKEKIMMIVGSMITIYQLQENQLSIVLIQRSDVACVTLLKNIRNIRSNKQLLFSFQHDLFQSRNSLDGLPKELCDRIIQEPSTRVHEKPASHLADTVCSISVKGTLAYLERKE